MVGVTKIQRGNAGYWLAAVAEGGDDYYTKPGEAPGEWIGELAGELGLSGQVHAEEYSAILEGSDPTSGAQLVKRPDTRYRERPDGTEKRVEPVLGYDVRFSAPKSGVRRGTVRGSDVYGLTAVSLAHGARLCTDPDYDRKGALAPAQAFDPASFLDALELAVEIDA